MMKTTRRNMTKWSRRNVSSTAMGEAAVLLGISPAFAYKLVARGELLGIRLGRRRLVPEVALLDFVVVMPEGTTLR
jgi:excisionase family DNA binding protein